MPCIAASEALKTDREANAPQIGLCLEPQRKPNGCRRRDFRRNAVIALHAPGFSAFRMGGSNLPVLPSMVELSGLEHHRNGLDRAAQRIWDDAHVTCGQPGNPILTLPRLNLLGEL